MQVAEGHAAAQQEDTQLQDLIRMWCKTKAVVALSSAEAEFYGLVRASAETMGLVSMYKDLGTHMNGVVLGDASAALAIWTSIVCGSKRKLPRVTATSRKWLVSTMELTCSRNPVVD